MVKPPEWRRKICAKTMWNVSIIHNYKKIAFATTYERPKEKKRDTNKQTKKHLAVTFLC